MIDSRTFDGRIQLLEYVPYFPVVASFDISLLAQSPLNRCGKFGL